MKKFLLSLMALFAVTMAATAANAYKTLTFPDDNSANNKVSSYTNEWDAIIGNDTWKITNFNNYNWDNWTYIKCGSKKAASIASIATSFAIDKVVTDVVVTIDKISTPGKINSIKLVVASDSEFTNVVETVDADLDNIASGDLTFTTTAAPARCYYNLVFDIQKTGSNGIIQISKIVYNAEGEAEPETQVAKPVLSWSSGTYYGPIEVACTTATEGATIMYSKDGGETYHEYELPIAIGTSCELEVYATKDGLQDSEHVTAQYTIAEPTIVNSIAEANAEAENGTVVKFANPVTCVYQNDAYTYVKDATGYTLLYGKGLPAYTNGSVVPAGFFGKMTIYNDLIEFTTQLGNGIYSAASFTESTESVAPVEPAVVKVADVTAEKMNQYVKIESVTYNAAGKTLVDGENKLVVYNRFKGVELPVDGTYTVTGFVSIFNGTVQIYPTAFETPSGVEEINAAAQENGQVYNLLGQPVSADTKDQILVKNGKKFINK